MISPERPVVYEWLKQFDKAELPHQEWIEQMKEAVIEYNEAFNTDLNPTEIVKNYISKI